MLEDLFFALLTAQQLDRISAQGAWIEFNPFAEVDESKDPLRRAIYHVQGPAAINALLQELIHPGAIPLPGTVQELGASIAQKVLIFGAIETQNGNLFISKIDRAKPSASRSVFP